VRSLVGKPMERGGGTGQYLIRGEGAGKRGDGEVPERAWPDGVPSPVGSSSAHRQVPTGPAARREGGEAEEWFA
jgi:hypothetical protein